MAVSVEGTRRKERILCLFDVDGTLTPARQVRAAELQKLPLNVTLALVTHHGATRSQTLTRPGEQLGTQRYRPLLPRGWDPGPPGLPGPSARRVGWGPRYYREPREWIQPWEERLWAGGQVSPALRLHSGMLPPYFNPKMLN